MIYLNFRVIVILIKLIRRKPFVNSLKYSLYYFLIFILGVIVNILLPYDKINLNKDYSYSTQIQKLYLSDQDDRKFLKTYIFPNAQQKVNDRDSIRLREAKNIYRDYVENKIILNTQDKFNLAMLFQHGKTIEDYEIAHKLAKEVTKSGKDIQNAGWLEKATYDRLQLAKGKPQKYGTQKKL